MTIKVGTGSSAVEPTQLRLAGLTRPVSRVMVGIGDDAVPAYVREVPALQPITVGSTGPDPVWTSPNGNYTTGQIGSFQVTGGGKGHFKLSIDSSYISNYFKTPLRALTIRRGQEIVASWSLTENNSFWVLNGEPSDEVVILEDETLTVWLQIEADNPEERFIYSWNIELIPTPPTVPAVDTSTILTVSPTEAAWGDPVTLTATVTPSNAVGSVTFDGAGETSTVSLVDGVATATRTFSEPGEYEVSAEFVPTSEEDFLPSSDTSSVTVIEGAPQVVEITGTSYMESRNQFRDALTARGFDYQTVETLPFALDTSQATNLEGLFSFCSELTEVPGMDTSNVTRMDNMFAHCSSLAEVPAMDTSNVTTMIDMFNGCSSLTEVPEMDTSNVTNMTRMFQYCAALTSVPDMDTSNVTNMNNMFSSTTLTSVPEMDTSQVTNMNAMFAFNSSLVEVPEMDTSNVTNMSFMFAWCTALTYVPDMDTSNVTNMMSMLTGTQSLTDGNVKLFGRHPDVDTTDMISNSGLTFEPFYTHAVETTTTLTVVPTEITEGESISLTATVTPTDAVGSVTFTVAGETSTVVVDNGTATGTFVVDLVGTHEVSADFVPADTDDFLPSSGTGSLTVLEFVPAVETTTVLTVVPNEITEGEQVILTATVTPSEAVGEVTFAVGTQTSTVALVGGTASTTVTLDTPGAYDVTADFIPSSVDDFTASSATGSITVLEYVPDPVETTTTLTVVPDEIEEGESVTVTATVSPSEAPGVVEFDVAGQLSSVNVVNGEAVATVTLNVAGEYDITADFVPTDEADFLPSSATGSITVVEGGGAALEPMEWSYGGSAVFNPPTTEVTLVNDTVVGTGVASIYTVVNASGYIYLQTRRGIRRTIRVYVNGDEVGSASHTSDQTEWLIETFTDIELRDGDTFKVTHQLDSGTSRARRGWTIRITPQ